MKRSKGSSSGSSNSGRDESKRKGATSRKPPVSFGYYECQFNPTALQYGTKYLHYAYLLYVYSMYVINVHNVCMYVGCRCRYNAIHSVYSTYIHLQHLHFVHTYNYYVCMFILSLYIQCIHLHTYIHAM
jgi:hypothetical protein